MEDLGAPTELAEPNIVRPAVNDAGYRAVKMAMGRAHKTGRLKQVGTQLSLLNWLDLPLNSKK